MHICEEFRERITEHIIDREEVSAKSEFQHELLICSSCSEFYAESREMIEALSEIDLSISESQWKGIQQRLNARILKTDVDARFTSAFSLNNPERRPGARAFMKVPVLVAIAALLVVTIGLSRFVAPVAERQTPAEPAQAVYLDHSVSLDPVTVDFLEESELLLRNVMKIAPNDAEDLADAKKVANEQLGGLEQRKEAAADVPPVVGVMETYESVLRDLRNVDERTASEDIGDIQRRIQKNGLIANMKSFQPRVTEIGFGLR
jgi:hypothetical protein